MSDQPIVPFSMLHLGLSEGAIATIGQIVREVVHEELATKQHTHKTGMRRFTFPWGDSHVEGVAFSHMSHPGLIAVCNGGFYDFYMSIGAMCAKLNILEQDIIWIDEVTV